MHAHHVDFACSTTNAYTRAAIAIHWLIALALVGQLALGWWMLDIPKSPPGLRAGWFNLHKSIGITLALLVLLRIAWRARRPVAPDASLPRWQRSAARLTHAALYASMLVVPLSGYLGSTFTRYPVKYFGLVLPQWNSEWPAAKELMSSVHYGAVWLLMALIALHVAAALWHWLRRDGVCARMGVPPLQRGVT